MKESKPCFRAEANKLSRFMGHRVSAGSTKAALNSGRAGSCQQDWICRHTGVGSSAEQLVLMLCSQHFMGGLRQFSLLTGVTWSPSRT